MIFPLFRLLLRNLFYIWAEKPFGSRSAEVFIRFSAILSRPKKGNGLGTELRLISVWRCSFEWCIIQVSGWTKSLIINHFLFLLINFVFESKLRKNRPATTVQWSTGSFCRIHGPQSVSLGELRYMSHIPAYQFHIFESGNIPNRSAHWPAPSGRLPGLRLPVFDHPSLWSVILCLNENRHPQQLPNPNPVSPIRDLEKSRRKEPRV